VRRKWHTQKEKEIEEKALPEPKIVTFYHM
jgi:hypothetical protein